MGLGFVGGAVMHGFRPRGTLANDQERLLLLVVPLAVASESWIAIEPTRVCRSLLLRGFVALSSGPLLMLGGVYLTGEASGWSPSERAFLLLAVGALILIPWLMLATRQQRGLDPTISLSLAATSLAVGITTILSGYGSARQLALPLAAVVAATAFAGTAVGGPRSPEAVGVGWICLAGILFIARLFGSLTSLYAVLLGATPLGCWLAVCRPLSSWPGWPRRLVILGLTLLMLGSVAGSMQYYVDFGR